MFRFQFELIVSVIVFIFVLSPVIIQFAAGLGEQINLTDSDGYARRVQLLVDGDNVYTVWTGNTNGEKDDVFFAKSTDGGKSFESKINLSQNNGSSAFPRLAVSESNVYVVWYDYTPGQSDIFFAKSSNGGNSFDVTNISDTPMPSFNPWIAAFSDYVYLVFNDGGRSSILELPGGEKRIVDVDTGEEELILLRSEDSGETFEFKNLSDSPFKTSWNARIKVLENNVFVTWNEKSRDKSDIFFSKSTDYGKSFSKPMNLSNGTSRAVDSAIGVFENNIYIVWNDINVNFTEIFFAKSTDNGKSFDEPIRLSNSAGTPILNRDGSIAVSDEKIFVVWYDESEKDNYIYFTKSTDGGSSFSVPIDLSQGNAIAKYPQVVADRKNVYVVWHDYSKGNGDIFLRESNDYGATFSGIKNLSDDEYESNLVILGPQIALSEDRAYTVWESKFEDGSDLYLTSFSKNQGQTDGAFEVSTLNEAVQVEIGFDANQLDAKKPTSFTLKFYDPPSKSLLSDVNYSIEIFDAPGKKIANMENLFAESGIGAHLILFPDSGPFNLVIDIKGTGRDAIHDTQNSGTVSVIFTVVPEFPIGVMMVFGTIIGFVIIFSFFRSSLFFPKNYF